MNIMSPTLGSRGSNEDEVCGQVGGKLREFEEGSITDIHGKSSLVSTFGFLLSGNFPPQQDNSVFCRPVVKRGCRICDVTVTDRENLDFSLTSSENQ